MNKKYNWEKNNSENEAVGNLSDLELGDSAIICGIITSCEQNIRQRLLDLGFVKGANISVQNISPLGDPIAYSIHETLIALRYEDALLVQVIKK